jgi:enoyl-[acyl-carrier-protein] reductase (NADH)
MEEMAHVTDFLISPLSSAITGQVIYVGLAN